MGGIVTGVKNKYASDTLKVSEGNRVEFLVTRLGQFSPAINVINWYGSQESRESVKDIQEQWDEIMKEIISIETKEEELILMSDANRHLGNYVKGNHPKTTFGGKLILDLLKSEEYVLVNATDLVVNGPFTHYSPSEPNNPSKKSLLDIIIVSKNFFKYIDKLEIDLDLKFTPSRSVKGVLKFPDHYALLLKLKNIPTKPPTKLTMNKSIIWNTRKKDG